MKENLPQSLFSNRSTEAIKYVQRPLYERKPIAYAETWFDAYIPNKTFYFSHEQRAELYAAGKRETMEDPAGTYAHKIFNRLLIDLSFNSSRLEGNTYSLLDTERLVLEGKIAEDKPETEKIMILNHKDAIRYLVDNAPHLKINKETICTLHFLLSESLVEFEHAGKIREHGVRIGGSTYLPYDNLQKLRSQFGRIIEKAVLIEDSYEQSLFLLIHITYLQAFVDVNKRTARLSANIPLITKNLVPLSFNDIPKEEYMSAVIAIYELQDVHPIIDMYRFSYFRTCHPYNADYSKYTQKLENFFINLYAAPKELHVRSLLF